MNRLLALGVIMTVVASGCLGSGSDLQVQPATHPRPQALAAHAWLVRFASREARALGDPSLKTALVAPITAARARLVFQHRRRAYPGDTYLVVLHGSFVTPNRPCSAEAWGCAFVTKRLFGWRVMLASPTLGRAWRYFGIETDGLRLRALPVVLKRIALGPIRRPRRPGACFGSPSLRRRAWAARTCRISALRRCQPLRPHMCSAGGVPPGTWWWSGASSGVRRGRRSIATRGSRGRHSSTGRPSGIGLRRFERWRLPRNSQGTSPGYASSGRAFPCAADSGTPVTVGSPLFGIHASPPASEI